MHEQIKNYNNLTQQKTPAHYKQTIKERQSRKNEVFTIS